MKRLARWAATLVAATAALIAVFAMIAWSQTAWLPYNGEGRYFDPMEEVVHTDAEPQFWVVLACTSSTLAAGAGLLRWKLRRR